MRLPMEGERKRKGRVKGWKRLSAKQGTRYDEETNAGSRIVCGEARERADGS